MANRSSRLRYLRQSLSGVIAYKAVSAAVYLGQVVLLLTAAPHSRGADQADYHSGLGEVGNPATEPATAHFVHLSTQETGLVGSLALFHQFPTHSRAGIRPIRPAKHVHVPSCLFVNMRAGGRDTIFSP